MKQKHRRLSAIDIGTNSIHMVIVEVDPGTGGFVTLTREKEKVRLGEGSGDMKYLSEAAMDRGSQVLRRFRIISDRYRGHITAIATSAVREAENKDTFIRRISNETGIRIETVSGIEEARLVYLGILQALPVVNRKILLIDLGGGSTEFLLGQRRKIFYDNSLKLGAVRLTEQFFPRGVVNPKAVRECRRHIRGILNPVRRELKKMSFDVAVGTSGTVESVARMIHCSAGGTPLPHYNSFSFDADQLHELTEEILSAGTPADRMEICEMDPARADIIAAGAVLLDQIVTELRIGEITVSEYGLREGLIRDVAEKTIFHKGTPGLHDIRLASVRHLAENLGYEKAHSHQVASLALQLFDQTSRIHRLGPAERELLEAAAILHEVGLFLSHEKHHQHSYYLIRNADLLGFREDEKEVVANIARYHRKSHPKAKHENFRGLPQPDQAVVKKLAAILRIADGLDKTHYAVVRSLKVSGRGSKLAIKIRRRGGVDSSLEEWGANQKKDLFEEVFRKSVVIS